MPSQGLGPRRSVLPLLISFLFSHIVLAELSFPLLSVPSSRASSSYQPVLSLPSSSFSSFFLLSPSFALSLSLFLSVYFPFASLLVVSLYLPSLPYLAPWESARVIRAARKEVLIPASRTLLALLSLSFSIRSLESLRSIQPSTRFCPTVRIHLLI